MKTRFDEERILKAELKRERRRVKRGAKPRTRSGPVKVGLLVDTAEPLEGCPINGYRAYDYHEPVFIPEECHG